jgi:hypothetical protein
MMYIGDRVQYQYGIRFKYFFLNKLFVYRDTKNYVYLYKKEYKMIIKRNFINRWVKLSLLPKYFIEDNYKLYE